MAKSYEHQEQVAFFQWCALNERNIPQLRWVHAVPNGGYRHKQVAAKLKEEGVKSGVLDVCVPAARRGYHGAYIEFKYGKNSTTNNQDAFISFVNSEKYATTVVYSWMEAKRFVEWYFGKEAA